MKAVDEILEAPKPKGPPCSICRTESVVTMAPFGSLCDGHDGAWRKHVDALVDSGKWPAGTPERGAWSEVWGAWLQAQRRAA